MTTTEKQNTPALAVLERRRQEEAERKAQIEARIAARRRAKAEHDAQFITISMLVHRFRDAHPAPGISYGMIVFETLRSDDKHEGRVTPLFCRWAAWKDWTDGRDERDWHPDDARWTPLPPCPVTCFCRLREGEGVIWGQEYTHVANGHTEKRGNCTITAPDPLWSALAQYGFGWEYLHKSGHGKFNAGALAIRVEDAARLFGPEVVAEPAVRPSASAPAGADPEPVAAPAVAVPAPMPRQRYQEAEVLRVLRELGHDPAALPARPRGKPGAKAAAWRRLAGKKWSRGVFEKAWGRLRALGEVVGD